MHNNKKQTDFFEFIEKIGLFILCFEMPRNKQGFLIPSYHELV